MCSALLGWLGCAAPELAPLPLSLRVRSGQWMPAPCYSWAQGEEGGSVGASKESAGLTMLPFGHTPHAHTVIPLQASTHASAHASVHARVKCVLLPIVSLPEATCLLRCSLLCSSLLLCLSSDLHLIMQERCMDSAWPIKTLQAEPVCAASTQSTQVNLREAGGH